MTAGTQLHSTIPVDPDVVIGKPGHKYIVSSGDGTGRQLAKYPRDWCSSLGCNICAANSHRVGVSCVLGEEYGCNIWL